LWGPNLEFHSIVHYISFHEVAWTTSLLGFCQ